MGFPPEAAAAPLLTRLKTIQERRGLGRGKMQHKEADQTLAVERYLLGDMTAAEVEQFEEHLFLCPECAESVKTGAIFVDNASAVFKEPATQAGTESMRQAI